MRTVGLGPAFLASALWLLTLSFFLSGPPSGAPFEILFHWLAVPVSIVAAVLLVLTLRRTRTPVRLAAATLVSGSAALLLLLEILVLRDWSGLTSEVFRPLVVLGIAAFAVGTITFALPRRQPSEVDGSGVSARSASGSPFACVPDRSRSAGSTRPGRSKPGCSRTRRDQAGTSSRSRRSGCSRRTTAAPSRRACPSGPTVCPSRAAGRIAGSA